MIYGLSRSFSPLSLQWLTQRPLIQGTVKAASLLRAPCSLLAAHCKADQEAEENAVGRDLDVEIHEAVDEDGDDAAQGTKDCPGSEAAPGFREVSQTVPENQVDSPSDRDQ